MAVRVVYSNPMTENATTIAPIVTFTDVPDEPNMVTYAATIRWEYSTQVAVLTVPASTSFTRLKEIIRESTHRDEGMTIWDLTKIDVLR